MVVLPAPDGPTSATLLPGSNAERHAVQDSGIAVITEADILEGNRAAIARDVEYGRAGRIDDTRLGVNGGEHAMGGGNAGRCRGPKLAQIAYRLLGQQQSGDEADKGGKRQMPVQALIAGKKQNKCDHQAGENIRHGRRRRTQPHRLEQRSQPGPQPRIHPRYIVRLKTISLDDAPSIHGFRKGNGKIAGLGHAARGGPAHGAAQPLHRPSNRWQRHQGKQTELPVAGDHDANIDNQLHQLEEDGGDALGQRIPHQGGVIEKIGNELARMYGIEIGQIATDQSSEHVALGLGHRLFAQRVDQHAAEEQPAGPQNHDAERHQGEWQQQFRLVTHKNLIGDATDKPRDRAPHRRGKQHAEHGQRQQAPLPTHIVAQQSADDSAGAGLV